MNFQTVLLTDFFNSLKLIQGTSLLSIFVLIIVVVYSIKFFFFDLSKLGCSPTSLIGTSWVTAIIGFLLFGIVLVMYLMYVFTVNMPLGMIFVTGYLVMNTFFSIVWYEGSNFINILPAISDEITSIGADLPAADVCEGSNYFSISRIFFYIGQFIVGTIKYTSAYLFEILLLLFLLGGIGTYMTNFKSTLNAKSAMSSLSNTSISSAFKQLFTWLILINIILIILVGIFMVQKYYGIQAIQVNTNFKSPMSMEPADNNQSINKGPADMEEMMGMASSAYGSASQNLGNLGGAIGSGIKYMNETGTNIGNVLDEESRKEKDRIKNATVQFNLYNTK